MRKNSPRKWLHACLDLLPVILIPVFMIYSHRHDVTENVQVQYKYQSNEVNTLDNLIEGNIYYFEYSGSLLDSSTWYEDMSIYFYQGYIEFTTNDLLEFYSNINNENPFILYYENDKFYLNLIDTQFTTEITYFYCEDIIFSFSNLQQFKLWFSENLDLSNLPQYTDYNVIESVDIENTDVMDSFMNHFNNTIDKHFNMGNVFNLTGVYDWFNINIFNGNAPQVIYSVWNIALYELVMDLLFLLYGLFMWFIDMVQHLMDKPFKSIK